MKLPLVDRRREARSRVLRGSAEARRPHRSAQAPPVRALRRPAAARRDRARARLQADGRVRRRADRQPRLADGRARSSSCCAPRRGARPDDGDGDPRRERRRDRRPGAVPRGRPIVEELADAAARPRSSQRWTAPARDPRRARRPARAQAPDGADGDRDRARRRDGQRHLRAHRLDRQGVQLDLHRRAQGLGRRRHRQGGVRARTTARRTPTIAGVAARRRCGRSRRRRWPRAASTATRS